MANFQAEKLRRYIQDSIALTMMATGRDKQRTMELIVEEMGDIRTVAALRKWAEKRRTSPIDASLLSRFAWVCLQHVRRWVQPTNWVTDLFAANGMGPEDMSPMLRQALAARLAGRPAIVARDLAVLRDEYVAHLTMWAGSRRVIAGTSGHQHQGTRPSRLVRQSLPGSGSGDRPVLGMEDELLDIGDLLQGQPRRVAILGPAGRGKSTLWRHLAGQLAQGPASLGLPVPLDWDDVTSAAVDTVTTLLQAAIHRTWPQCPLHEQQVLAFYLEDRLRQGTAVALIDNWRRLHPLARSQADRWRAALASWPRLIILSRYAPGPDDVTIQLFDLHGLDDHAIAHFVRDWPASTGRVLDPAAVLAQVTQATALRDLAPEPLFLNLMCTVAARQPDGPIGRCTVLDGALAELTTHETRGSQPAADADLRAALAELAWAGYWREHPDRPVQRSFDSAQVGDLWRAKLGERGQWLCGLVRERGLLRRAPGDNQLAFPHEALQAALAAEAWLRQPDWLEHLCAVKSQPPWADVIVCAAARLGHEGRLVELERLLGRLCAPEGSDVLALHWLLAGRCLGELPEPVREQLERLGIGGRIRGQLVAWLGDPVCPELQRRVRDVLVRAQTTALTQDPAALALLAAVPPGLAEGMPPDLAPWLGTLGDLIAQWPATWRILGQLCLAYDIRVLPDHSVILADGRQLPYEKARLWLQMPAVS